MKILVLLLSLVSWLMVWLESIVLVVVKFRYIRYIRVIGM